MSPSPRRLAGAAAMTALLAACDRSPTPPREPVLRATVTGAVETTLEGPGEFTVGFRSIGGQVFEMTFYRQDGTLPQLLTVTSWPGGRLDVGRHPVRLTDDPIEEALTVLVIPRGQPLQLFAADSGEVVITRSFDNRVEGRLTLSAFRYCEYDPAAPPGPDECELPGSPPTMPGLPRIRVTGTFAAIPWYDFRRP